MPTQSNPKTAVHFRGAPSRLAAAYAVGKEALPRSPAVTVQLHRGGPPMVLRAFAHGVEPNGAAWLRLSLPPGTPPGSYEGDMTLGRRKLPVVIQVEGRAHFRLTPTSLVLSGGAKDTVAAELTIANDGNLPLKLRKVTAFGVFEVAGVDRAFGKTFRAKLEPGERRLDRLVEELAKQHGGLVRAVLSTEATLKAGTVATLRVKFRLPDNLLPGRIYDGSWPLRDQSVPVRIEVPGPPDEEG